MTTPAPLQLAAYRRAVAEMYARARSGPGTLADRCAAFRRERDALFAQHPQSALDAAQQARFSGLRYFPYDPALRLAVPLEPMARPASWDADLPEDGRLRLAAVGRLRFQLAAQPVALTLYWAQGYGGGLFLPFHDQTNGAATYGGGRYLLDGIKGADLGLEDGRLVIDFNYAYNPSCAYNARWVCPLAPAENWLPVPVAAGELAYKD